MKSIFKCSLIIPAFNAGSTIEVYLRSALEQTLPRKDYEIIMVDDGSTDNTFQLAKRYPIKVLQQNNQGPAAARNTGARQANGDILVFADIDCELDQAFLQHMIKAFERDDVVGVQGAYRTQQTEFIARFTQVEIEARYQRLMKQVYIDFIGTYAAGYRREVFLNNGGFDTNFTLPSGEDAEFSYRLQEQGYKLSFCPAAYVYHRHPTSLKNYLRLKFSRGYWGVRLYRLHPKKVFSNSYIPQSLKIQVLVIPLIPFAIILSFMNPFWLLSLILLGVLYGAHSVPFIKAFKNKGYGGKFFIPAILLLRASALALGILTGMVKRVYATSG